MDKSKLYWNEFYNTMREKNIKYDNWLDSYIEIINNSKGPIIDLGCGIGNNSLYLLEKNKDVIACDYSEVAIEIIKENIKAVKAKCFDMKNDFPFDNNFTDLIIADLSLHYFSKKDTLKILNELKRILKNDSTLLFRVNSLDDINYGANDGQELEKHYYQMKDGNYKRFFDKNDICDFFNDWNILNINSCDMNRYGKKKIMWKCSAKKCD